MSYGSALTVLETIVRTWALANGFTADRIVMDNQSVRPGHGAPFLVCSLLPAESRPLTIGQDGVDAHPGIYQVAVHVESDAGIGSALAVADALAGEFKRTQTTEDGVAVHTFRAWVSGGFRKDDWFVVPVSVAWEFHA